MDNNIKFNFTEDELAQFESEVMQMIYETIIVNIDDAIDNQADRDEKLMALHKILKYFEKKEEYEKCKKLKEIINEV